MRLTWIAEDPLAGLNSPARTDCQAGGDAANGWRAGVDDVLGVMPNGFGTPAYSMLLPCSAAAVDRLGELNRGGSQDRGPLAPPWRWPRSVPARAPMFSAMGPLLIALSTCALPRLVKLGQSGFGPACEHVGAVRELVA
jgi:hypothetical protein